jgi:hypothetical protein
VARLTVRTPDDAEVAELFPEDEGAKGIGSMPDGITERLEELGGLIDTDTTITLVRDWEGCTFGIVDGDERFEVLAFTEDGRVGQGGVNQPAYLDSVKALLGQKV